MLSKEDRKKGEAYAILTNALEHIPSFLSLSKNIVDLW